MTDFQIRRGVYTPPPPPPAEGPLSWDQVEVGMRFANGQPGAVYGTAASEWVRANADRIRAVPVTKILRRTNWWESSYIEAVLLLESLGTLTIEHDDLYVSALSRTRPPTLESMDDLPVPDFFELVWRMISLAPKYVGAWLWAAERWVGQGFLVREEVMRALLVSLSSGAGNTLARTYLECYALFEPTLDDLDRDQDVLRRMLIATEVATPKFALERSRDLFAAGRLDVAAFLGSAPDLSIATAVNARLVLGIARGAAGSDAMWVDEARRLHSAALGHANRDIQSMALSWLTANGGEHMVDSASDRLSPALARDRVQVLPEGSAPAPRAWRKYQPWQAHEVIDRTVALRADTSDPLEVEAGLAAWAAMDDATRSELGRMKGWGPDGVINDEIGGLIGYAAYMDSPDFEPSPRVGQSWRGVSILTPRFTEVKNGFRDPAPRVLLATPCSAAGWVDADVLVERMLATERAGQALWAHDLTAAILRINPDDPNRDTARGMAVGSDSEHWAAVAYALGGPAATVATPAWWVAAARARTSGVDDLLVDAGLDLPGQGRPVDAALRVSRWRDFYPTEHKADLKTIRVEVVSSYGDPAPAGPSYNSTVSWIPDQPTVITAAHVNALNYPSGSRHPLPWAGTVWPRSVEYAASLGVLELALAALDEPRERSEGALRAIADSPGEIGELGRGCVAFGFSNLDRVVRAQAAELFAAEAGARLDMVTLAGTMATVAEACKLTRWAESLRDAASMSRSTAISVTQLLAALLPQLDRTRSGMSALLELLDDELRRTGTTPTDASLLHWLESFRGASKSAKAAKGILRLAA